MIYTINPYGMNSYEVRSKTTGPLDSVWLSQKYLFSSGVWVTVSDEFGNRKTYMKE